MAAKYWIKLYHEILLDPKMGRLPDDLWRRAIELFLMAGELDDQGRLPSAGDIAWRLRQSEEALEADLNRLQAVGILTKNDDGTWLVTNFAKRQAPTETIDRVRQFRERKRKQTTLQASSDEKETGVESSDYANVTKRYIDTDTDTDTDSSTNVEGDKSPPVKPKRAKRETVVIPEAVKVYQDIARRLPDKVLWLDIETKVGATPESLERWGATITAYIGCGWNKLNTSGMLSFFEGNRMPSTQPQKANGLSPPNKSSPPLSAEKQEVVNQLKAQDAKEIYNPLDRS